ncbi:MAG: sirohydrochlorin chelatase, partial [Burkholderiales bacterium]
QTDPELPVIRLAFIEHCEPLLEDVLEVLFTQKCQTIHIQPLLISGGFHLEVDVPTRLQHWRESHPEIDISLDKALLEHALMRQAIRTIVKQQ